LLFLICLLLFVRFLSLGRRYRVDEGRFARLFLAAPVVIFAQNEGVAPIILD